MRRKTLQELTIIDNFMFGAVMMVETNCRELLELILDIEIERVEVSKEKSIVYNPEYKGVRLDVYAKDERNTHYNVEMQALQDAEILKRSRYYHSQLDMEFLMAGETYRELPETYVIFICDFDPFGEAKYRYTMRKICEEEPELNMDDGERTIFLSTKGANASEVPKGLVAFLKYVSASLEESEKDFQDDYVAQLQDAVKNIKVSREMGARYMTLQMMLADERAQGRMEGRMEGRLEGMAAGVIKSILTVLGKFGEIPESVSSRIKKETKEEMLNKWLVLAATAESIAQFQENM